MPADAQALARPPASVARATTPRATMRLQLHKGFTLDDAAAAVPYLAALGISHVYASPLLKARPGSTHCYDIVDHGAINPELGGEAALHRLVAALRAHAMGLIVDIVPNHMGVGGADNAWWLDLLEWGRASPFAAYFDIDWTPPDTSLSNRILAPFLGSAYGETLANGELVLQCDAASGALFVGYHEHRFPISAASAARILQPAALFEGIAEGFLAAARARRRVTARIAAAGAKRELAAAARTPEGEAALAGLLAAFAPDTQAGRHRLNELLDRQHYRLAWWRAAADEINWRRFFDINTLAGLRVELPRVFDATHALILKLYAQGLIDGVRIDHIDGLADPRLYCRKLRRALETAGEARPPGAPRGRPYILVEKILAPRERLPLDWQADGTTGYDFMDQAGGVLHDPAGEAALTEIWVRMTGRPGDFETEERDARRQIMRDNLASELNATAAALHRLARRDLFTRDYTLTAIRRALTEILIYFPVYRIYAGRAGTSETDAHVMERAIAGARRSFRTADAKLLGLVQLWVAGNPLVGRPRAALLSDRLRGMVRFQQLSAPVAAKSVEDTAFYRYGRLLSRNEVGSDPGQFAVAPQSFHAAAAARGKLLPGAMLATATHDHKRGEDTRARLAVLSEIPQAWETALIRWTRLNALFRRELDAGIAPAPADEIMLYQTLVAAWPLGLGADDSEGIAAYAARISAWAEKSVREAKLRSEWAAPDEAYEAALHEFIAATLDPKRPVLAEIAAFAARLDLPGAVNGLTQTLLRLTAPGVPDLYQGTEFWDQSLVDPDNRRPVDFTARAAMLNTRLPPAARLAAWRDGGLKQAVIARALSLRAAHPLLFAKGGYQRLDAEGPAAAHVLAFARRHGDKILVAAAVRLPAGALEHATLPLLPPAFWAGTTITLPRAGFWQDTLRDQKLRASAAPMQAGELFAALPVALLLSA